MKYLRPLGYKKEYEQLVAKKISNWMYETYYKGCFELIREGVVNNDSSDVVIEALQSGRIYYENGGFYSKSGRFPNKISKELERLGAKYSKYRKAYLIDIRKLDTRVMWAIQTMKARASAIAQAISVYLTKKLGNISIDIQTLVLDEAIDRILLNLQKRLFQTLDEKKIPIISPKLDSFKKEYIFENYINNLRYWISEFEANKIPEMRQVILDMVLQGKGTDSIVDYLEDEFDIDQRKAMFLARNETALATSSYLASKYVAEGFTSFKWVAKMDERTRELHKELDGKIFRFDDPPVIYEYKGEQQRGLPGMTYNCRCLMIPVFDEQFIKNRIQNEVK